MKLADTANTNHYELGGLGLELGRTYYWRIDEVNDAEIPSVWESDVWHFNTPEYVVVDDFESYTNDADTYSRVFQTWIDGAGYTVPVDVPGNGTGSFIGHDPALGDIMETEIVHGGAQSAPIYYGNGGQRISEVDRTFDEPQDWTRAGIKSLSGYPSFVGINADGDFYSIPYSFYYRNNPLQFLFKGYFFGIGTG